MKNRRRGMTLVEVMLSCGLLSLLLVAFFTVLDPVVGKALQMDQKHTDLQGFAVLRDYLVRRLDDALIAEVSAARVAFYMPDRVDTPEGAIDRINSAEVPQWNMIRLFSVELRAVEDDQVVTEVVSARAPGGGFQPQHIRALWNLGPGGELNMSWMTPSLLQVLVAGRAGQISSGRWERVFTVHVPE